MPPSTRLLPELDEENRFFWTAGAGGKLQILRCQQCGYYIHPYAPICPECLCRDVKPEPVSGRATVSSFTINHQKWHPMMEVPFVIAIVELVEQPALNLTTNIINTAIENVTIGMPVRVVFEACEDVHVPLFEPDDDALE